MGGFPGLRGTFWRESFSSRKWVSRTLWVKWWVPTAQDLPTTSLCPRNAREWSQPGLRQADTNSITWEGKVFLTHAQHTLWGVLIINDREFIVQKTLWKWGLVTQRSVVGSRKAVATHGHRAPTVTWYAIITELVVGWHLVKLLGTQQPEPREVYSTITELLPE